MAVRLKDPQETIDYAFDWSDFLASGETISASTWSIAPASTAAGALALGTLASTTDTTAAFVTSGTVGVVYRLTNKITTNQTRIAERSVIVRVEER